LGVGEDPVMARRGDGIYQLFVRQRAA
jgi:hypothetical protein